MSKFKVYLLTAAGLLFVSIVAGIGAGPAIAQVTRATLVRNVDERARNAVQYQLKCVGNASSCVLVLPAVPTGKRLLIDRVNMAAFVEGNGRMLSLSIENGASPAVRQYLSGSFFVELPATPFGLVFRAYYINQSVSLVADAGQAPTVVLVTNTIAQMDVTVSGYLIDLAL